MAPKKQIQILRSQDLQTVEPRSALLTAPRLPRPHSRGLSPSTLSRVSSTIGCRRSWCGSRGSRTTMVPCRHRTIFRQKTVFRGIFWGVLYPLKLNSLPLKSYLANRKVVFQPPFFRGYVKLREGNWSARRVDVLIASWENWRLMIVHGQMTPTKTHKKIRKVRH